MYDGNGVVQPPEFDFSPTAMGWEYNAYLNQLCSLSSNINKIIHRLEHDTPLYTVGS